MFDLTRLNKILGFQTLTEASSFDSFNNNEAKKWSAKASLFQNGLHGFAYDLFIPSPPLKQQS